MSDAQLATLKESTWDSIGLINGWVNSSAFWELMGTLIGLVLAVAILMSIVNRGFNSIGFRSR